MPTNDDTSDKQQHNWTNEEMYLVGNSYVITYRSSTQTGLTVPTQSRYN